MISCTRLSIRAGVGSTSTRAALERPDPDLIEAHIARFQTFKDSRDAGAVGRALDDLARAAESDNRNVFEGVVEAATVGVTNGEICSRLRDTMGFGQPLVLP